MPHLLKPFTPIRSLPLIVALLAFAACGGETGAPPTERISEFGRYEGYSEERFPEWVNTSRYVEMRDGVKLAVDITRPAVNGEAVDEKFPVVWTHSRYHRNPGALRRFFAGPAADSLPPINSQVDADPGLQRLVKHGYVVAAVQVRGGGASFGRYQGLFSEAETKDAAEIINWLATQPWSDGNVGMYGGSYLGITQYMAASEQPPALKAIFPNVAALDMYDVLYPGGVYRKDMIDHWGGLTKNLDLTWKAPKVATDIEGTQLEDAIEEHKQNWDVQVEYAAGKLRDYEAPEMSWSHHGPSGVLDKINQAKVPAYHWNGWYDIFVLDAALLFNNYQGPDKLGIGAWSHGGMPDSALMVERARLTAIEQHRWFDYWLKGIDNGIMNEPPIHYAVMDDPGKWSWKSANQWPVPEAQATDFYFTAGSPGVLTTTKPEQTGSDRYRVDLTTTTGDKTRWDNAVGGAPLMIYPDLAPNDAKSLTYTTEPLTADVTVTGHPVVTLWLTSSTSDADLIVLLEEVDQAGVSHYVTEGVLRASHRKLGQATWDNRGLPFQRSFRGDLEPLPAGTPAELQMDLHPTSTVFNAGHRIRVAIMGADADNIELPSRAPTLNVYRGGAQASRITLPVVP
ncbi:MAG: CocE/NonD family hydrolase [Gemmatimonadales bacterium]